MRTFTSREFNQDPTSAKRAALSGPVQITERGRVSHILLSIDQYQQMTHSGQSIVDLLAMPDDLIDFEPDKLSGSGITAADLD
ncbi:hypothetical protein P2G88_01215 [Aliiglaciecola sp. CAU 1673]|uniref:type II toxin-antitoxin system Phd/YefM family antitoxin n=1 Tax=Aliiglaciecola sp. CAU 1673 TaxID=3032595 RepID=UPI0023DC0936|nr:type II toxin-antitoxin system Phd/YefM family antitoxin [Aliiglaciecola sp. CAU 1673]MDF2176870.1 hypothetical protein [Aliiglaciecola sp. CAU 1673]